jgi:hypothetical protein
MDKPEYKLMSVDMQVLYLDISLANPVRMAIEVGKLKYYLKHQFIEMFSIQHWVL